MSIRHICVVTETYLPEVNGVANSLQHLFTHLNPDLYQITFVRPAPRVDMEVPDNEVWVKGISIPQYPDLQLGLPSKTALRSNWKANPPDLVYVATEGLLGASAVAIAREYKLPIISAFHTNFHRYSGYYGLGIMRRMIMGWMRRFHNRTHVTLVPSRSMVSELSAEGMERVEWLPHGVDCRRFNPEHRSATLREEWGVGPDEQVALCVGRVAAEKNLIVALNAVRQMRREGRQVRPVIVGDGPLRETLSEEFPEAVFTGVKTGQALSECFASADLFLMPSQTETFGLVTLEAMASGLPVVAYDMAAAREFVRTGVDGSLASDETDEAFTDALRVALRFDSTLMGLDARSQAEQLSWDMVARQFERRVEALLATHCESRGVVHPLQMTS